MNWIQGKKSEGERTNPDVSSWTWHQQQQQHDITPSRAQLEPAANNQLELKNQLVPEGNAWGQQLDAALV